MAPSSLPPIVTLALTAAAAAVATRMGVELLVAAAAGLLMAALVSMVEVAAHQTEAMVAVAGLLMAATVVVAEADVVPVDASRYLFDVERF